MTQQPDDFPAGDGPTWSATQEWLADLDRDGNDSDADEFDVVDLNSDPDPDMLEVGDLSGEHPGNDDPRGEASDLTVSSSVEPADPIPQADAESDTAEDDEREQDSTTSPRFNKTLVGGFIALVVVATVAVSAVLLGIRRTPQVDEQQSEIATKISPIPAAPPPPPADSTGPATVPFTASAPGCLPGSTAAQTVASGDPTQAWVCVRGGADGQVLTLDLGRTMTVTAIRLTPGWVGQDASGADQWLQHRVLTRVQWILSDHGNEPTVVPQETGNVHGEAPQPMPGQGVLASTITMVVLETARPPADAPPTGQTPASPPDAGGGLLNDVLGAPLGAPPASTPPVPDDPQPGLPGEQPQSDPVDNTFAVSSITVEGHPPIPS